MAKKIAILGGGNLGTAIAEGLLKSNFSQAADIIITRRNEQALAALREKGVMVTADNALAVRQAAVVILAVKPFQAAEVLQQVKGELNDSKILVSVVTGLLIGEMEDLVGAKPAYFRAMPNTAIAISESMTCICSRHAGQEQVKYVDDLFSTVGQVVTIDEKLMEAATILAACGTAYAMRYIRASIQGGIEIGFDANTASLIAAQTAKGAAELLLQKKSHPEQEIDKVTTPKGCTIAGLNEMEHQGFSSSLIRGIVASYKKIARD
ncbi:MAG TPA: pyrroline-5-carboxylate reductase [Chitinophagaceae bacterium]|nr:pyrroline-5-carboxylate reductase [Chitinophagaceae bacterium]